MTALNEYTRLEATALWRPDPEAQRRNVYVSLGEATLVIHDGKDVALAHWSLPAVHRLNPDVLPARYSPGDGAPEEIEVDDQTMVSAIERVRTAVGNSPPHPGRLRRGIILATVVAMIGAAAVWLPEALVNQTASIVPEASRAAIGEDVLAALRPLTGPVCSTPQGDRALARLEQRLLTGGDSHIAILPGGIAQAVHLPGGAILLGRGVVEDHETVDVAAGYVLAETARLATSDPLADLLRADGIAAALRLLTTGNLGHDTVTRHAQRLVSTEMTVPEASVVVPVFAAAGVSTSPYAYALDPTGETTLALIEADPARITPPRPVLTDGDWVALQNICN